MRAPVPACLARVAVSAVVAAATACTGIETRTGVYATLAEARAAGAVQSGWIPEGLPASATDLREAHRGRDQRWGLFSFPPAAADAVRALLAAEITGQPPECTPPGRLEWWPRVLRSPMDPGQLKATALRVYHGRDGRLTYAVNWNQGRGYFWSG